jgi:hypothetical protein
VKRALSLLLCALFALALLPTCRPTTKRYGDPIIPAVLSGDVHGPFTATVATAVQGVAISATPPTNGQVLEYQSGSTSYVPTTLGSSSGSTPTGTGFRYIATGTENGTAVAFSGDGAIGALSGSNVPLTISKVNGTSYGAGGALTTGNGPYVSGASATTYSALNLAGGAGWVSGQLPVASVANGTAAQLLVTNSGATAPTWVTMSGDCTNTAAGAVTCTKINSTSVQAGGALTTGNAAYVSGASATTYSALNLAGGAGWISGTLPVGNGGTGTTLLLGSLTSVSGGTTTTLSQASVQRVTVSTAAANTAKFPASPNNGDAIWVHTTGTTVTNQATLDPNGNHIEDPQAPGSTTGTTGTVTMGPNPGVSALYVYESSGTLWRLWQ